jgi:hypothetical protein
MTTIELTDDQKKKILEEWNSRPSNPPSLAELTKLIFGEGFDGRSQEGKAIKNYLASRQIIPKKSHEYEAKGLIELTEEQKEYISNNCSTMTSVEMAKIIFKNNDLTNLNQETRSVGEYIKTLDTKVVYSNPNNIPEGDYKPPTTFTRCLSRINRYVHEGIDETKLTGKQKRDIQAIIGYLHTYRFLHQINTYQDEKERELFESSFIRYTYDKNDLTQEEVDQYIVLATEVVISSNIQETIQALQLQMDANVEAGEKISMSLVEAISTSRNEYNQSVSRQQKLLQDLKVKRSDRLSKQVKENASILNLVELWKEEESRKEMIRLAEMRKELLSKEVERLSTIDEIKARILGLSKDEVLNG